MLIRPAALGILAACCAALFTLNAWAADPPSKSFDDLVALVNSDDPLALKAAERIFAPLTDYGKERVSIPMALIYIQHGKIAEAGKLLKISPTAPLQTPAMWSYRLLIACQANDRATAQKLIAWRMNLLAERAVPEDRINVCRLIGGVLEVNKMSGGNFGGDVVFEKQANLWKDPAVMSAVMSGRVTSHQSRTELTKVLGELSASNDDLRLLLAGAIKEEKQAREKAGEVPGFQKLVMERQAAYNEVNRLERALVEKEGGPAPPRPEREYRKSEVTNKSGKTISKAEDETRESKQRMNEYHAAMGKRKSRVLDRYRGDAAPPELKAARDKHAQLEAALKRGEEDDLIKAVRAAQSRCSVLRLMLSMKKEDWPTIVNNPAAYSLLDFAAEKEHLSRK